MIFPIPKLVTVGDVFVDATTVSFNSIINVQVGVHAGPYADSAAFSHLPASPNSATPCMEKQAAQASLIACPE